MKKNNIRVGVIGLWHLGSVYSACLAKLGFDVTGFDFDYTVINNLKKGIPPLHEPFLAETLRTHLNKNLHFTDSEREICSDKDYLFITFDLPVDEQDKVDLNLIKKAEKMLAKNINKTTTIIISSQVPLGTTRSFFSSIQKQTDQQIRLLYFPENLRLGNAFESFLRPDRIILGTDNEVTAKKFMDDFSQLECPFYTMSFESAEMVKHALNTYLAACISYSSEMSDLCERFGANMKDVVVALKTDKRVSGYAPINPGLGFSGGTLGRDIQSLRLLGKKANYETKLLNAVYAVNKDRLTLLMEKISSMLPTLSGSNIGILGLTYKPGTDTLRRSFSLELARLFHLKHADVKAYDPMIRMKIDGYPYIAVCETAEKVFQDSDLVILMTEWPEFLQLPIHKLAKLMKKKNIIDTKNFLESKKFIKEGYIYKGIGI